MQRAFDLIKKEIKALKGKYKTYDVGKIVSECVHIVNQVASEYGDSQAHDSKKIYNYIKTCINPYGKPFDGAVYEFGLHIMNYIKSMRTEEYGGGWITCSERLPEEHDSIFAIYKGTKKWDDAMFEKTSDLVNVTVVDKKGRGVTTYAHTTDGNWQCDLLRANKSYRIIAWQPLPEPYKPKFEFECANPASPELIREVHDKLRKI